MPVLLKVKLMGLTEELRKYAESLRLDFIGFCSADALDEAPEDRRPNVYLEEAASVISIGYRLNYAPIQSPPKKQKIHAGA